MLPRAWHRSPDQTTTQGVYHLINDDVVNVAIATADATNKRIDLVVAQVLDDSYSGVLHIGQIVAVTGTLGASPSPPATPKNAIVLANIEVDASVTSIVTAKITDERSLYLRGRATAWTNLSLGSGYSAFSGFAAAQYMIDASGIMSWRTATAPALTANVNSTVGTLPSGFRPAAKERFVTMANGNLATLDVDTAGVVAVAAVSNVGSGGLGRTSGISFVVV